MRKYKENECLVFRDGPLSNLYTGYPIQIGILTAFSSESLYQAAKFPHLHDVQREILRGDISQNPGTISERYRAQYREDWIGIRVQVMRWVLRAKLYNSEAFKNEIISTEDLQIVLSTRKDGYWGSVKKDGILEGENVFGRLIMELRGEIKSGLHDGAQALQPPNIPNFTYFGMNPQPIRMVTK